MRALAALLLVLAACGEPASVRAPPLDRFLSPSGLALTASPARPGGGSSALLVVSGNYDLAYDGATGGTLLSVNPDLAADGGSAGQPGGALVKLPAGGGARLGSYGGDLAVVDGVTCPGYVDPISHGGATALVASRYTTKLHRVPLEADGGVLPCDGPGCALPFASGLLDPYAVTVACRPDGARRSAFVGFLGVSSMGGIALAGHVAEVNLDDGSGAVPPFFPLGFAPISDLAYDAQTDRLFVATRPAISVAPSTRASLYVVDLGRCRPGDTGCPPPHEVDLSASLRGADLQDLAFSNVQPGLRRRLYVAARVYDVSLFALLGVRPTNDSAGALLVLDLEEDALGHPALKVQRILRLGIGPGRVAVLPVRPVKDDLTPRRDLVVVTTSQDGAVAVYDDETGQVVRIISIDAGTGAPEAGRSPYSLAVEPATTGPATAPVARVYVGAFAQSVVTPVDVPLLSPWAADPIFKANGAPARIGGAL